MNVQLGIYEIFATIIPGSVYLAALYQVLVMTKVLRFDWGLIGELNIFSTVVFVGAAYLIGLAFGHFGLVWHRLFKKNNQSEESLAAFKKKQQGRWTIDFDDRDWHILLAFIRSKNMDLARESERHHATSLMLRNVSLALMALAIIQFVQFFVGGKWVFLPAGIGIMLLSFLMIGESSRFRRWYYNSLLSTVLAYRIELEKSITPVKPIAKRKNSGQRGSRSPDG